jgi:hypothetical protein
MTMAMTMKTTVKVKTTVRMMKATEIDMLTPFRLATPA